MVPSPWRYTLRTHYAKRLFIVMLAVVLCLVCAWAFYITRAGLDDHFVVEQEDPDAPLSERLAFNVETSRSGPHEAVFCVPDEADEQYYVYLPSYAEMDRVKVALRTDVPLSLGGIPLNNGMACDVFPVGEALELSGEGLGAANLTFLASANVGTLYVDTSSGAMDAVNEDKYHRESVSLALFDAQGRLDYQSRFTDEIRGHGQSSWKRPKRSYNLYLDDVADLLGMGKAKQWVLVASMTDECNLRNDMIYAFARNIASYDGFAPKCAYLDVYLNGKYNGLYLLCQKLDINPSQLDIPQDSWLFVIDLARRTSTMKDSFKIDGGRALKIKNPSPCSDEQKDQLVTHLSQFQNALLSEDGVNPETGIAWNEYIDLESFARKFLIDEVFSNYDAGMASQYYNWNAEDGLIYAGPCWDYDGTLGIFTQKTPNCFLTLREWASPNEYTPWYNAMWRYPEFRDRVLTLYRTEFLPLLQDMMDSGIDAQAQTIEAAVALNRLRWKNFYETDRHTGSLDHMKAFLKAHIDFLNSAWIDGVDYRTITFRLDKSSDYQFFCLPAGSSCEDIPSPRHYGQKKSAYWCLEDSTPFDLHTTLDEDIFLVSSQFLKAGK